MVSHGAFNAGLISDNSFEYLLPATEIQNIQVADGNVCPMINIPIYMIFPRLFSCPTLLTENNFKVGKYSPDVFLSNPTHGDEKYSYSRI